MRIDVDRSATGAMAQWLEADLAANQSDWLIVYWHHPPYTKGTHDSDNPDGGDFELVEMRENILPILEQHGADLVLNGHSHNYERSKFIDGHYGYSDSYSDALYAKNTAAATCIPVHRLTAKRSRRLRTVARRMWWRLHHQRFTAALWIIQ